MEDTFAGDSISPYDTQAGPLQKEVLYPEQKGLKNDRDQVILDLGREISAFVDEGFDIVNVDEMPLLWVAVSLVERPGVLSATIKL